ncbi:MAG: threonine/serine exporter family protein [Actinobacteria bacterium]|jgi:uncharacterized membrane protein YjjP (DUF1212 family)|nr:threonine/serine exporter family protein [Actinomycetota bacterium]
MSVTPPDPRPGGGRGSSRLVAGTRRAFRPSGPPTDELPVFVHPDEVADVTARAVVDLALRAGIALLSTGAPAADVVATVLQLTRAYGMTSVHVDITFTSIAVSYQRGPHADPMTVMKVVRHRTQDFTRLERLRELVAAVAAHPIPVQEARERFDAVVRAPHPYRRWVVASASAVLAAAVALLIGAGPLIIALTFASALLIDRLQRALGRANVASFFTQCIAAAVPTAVAIVVVVAAREGWGPVAAASPSLIVASGIVLLLSGLSVVGAAQDALEGYYVTAGARSFEVVVMTLAIVIGVTTVLSIGNRIGLPIAVSSKTYLDQSLLLQVTCAVLIAAAFAVSAHARGRVVVLSGVLGAVGWVVATALGDSLGFGAAVSATLAAGVIGFLARAGARRLRAGALAVTTSAIVPLLPGRAVYQGISEMIGAGSEGPLLGLTTLAGAGIVGLGLAAGVSLGTYAAAIVSALRHRRPLFPTAA